MGIAQFFAAEVVDNPGRHARIFKKAGARIEKLTQGLSYECSL